jgi:hypothetical protein
MRRSQAVVEDMVSGVVVRFKGRRPGEDWMCLFVHLGKKNDNCEERGRVDVRNSIDGLFSLSV